MAKFSLIGNPISHSKSPALFNAAYPGSSHTYTLLQAPTCKEAIKKFMEGGYSGANVTSPFKDEVMEYVSVPDRISTILSSANTILCKEGQLHSYNTDYYGVKNTLEHFLQKYAPNTTPMHKERGTPLTTLVIGAGGAGKAAALASRDMGMHVLLANRSVSTAAPFASLIDAEYITPDKIGQVLNQTDIIIYALSMEIGQIQKANLRGKILLEANYASPNLSNSGAKIYIDGRYWLYNQAVPAFKLFTGEEPLKQAMRTAIGI